MLYRSISCPKGTFFMTTPPAAAEIFGDNLEKAIAYHESLATDGSVRGFIGPREVPRLWDRHILNCGVIGEAMDEGISVADIGSGAGLPGIPLAIARPDLNITLIEPLLKRSVYLNEVKEALNLDNVTVVRGRAEEKVVRKQVGLVDIVTSRAVAPLGKLATWSLPLVKIGGRMVAMKGSSVEEEIERDAKEIRKAGGTDIKVYTVGEALLSEPTTLISIRREK
ncbi:ribosomal RNA small subunit methyltransferase G [Corynebacterium glutamicum]|uniref:Ribosomal RNA small subunit methyltransferase G n=2 Tax=Corynebacterium glutamicum TaxID=1718 RepID=RSMG_CORGL|nr:RecName: Full=Ribosomal RNA small subunit methyltransferase G; AltName: Full=16S rRNA 7-methylguanosine methyltransferase; Short=16S rRNA m7G methyltransferase [Corynebacterium glutamicum ATCC 13032]ARV65736.1 ribosomal RNA small subunit methyltransferase G [Corynebacterium glutamicum]CCH26210.1 glucose-inhibited division protein B [Corynebacterium glutamicum K051]AUI02452.1 ribosomal RNA small subunit methyltransferase G [Corynebacterium glutamicum]AUI03270.1 ribosomal RNA small subunit met